jgi:hypothetical protein
MVSTGGAQSMGHGECSMAQSKPVEIRLTARTDAWAEQEARRTQRSKRALVETLVEEAARMRRFRGIAFRGPDDDRRAWLPGAGFDVWQLIEAYRGVGPIRFREEGDVPEEQLALALAYYAEYPEEIAEAIAANDESGEELEALYPDLFAKR